MRYALQETFATVQLAAASLLGRLQVQALHGPRVTLTLQRLLPPGLVAAIQASHSSGFTLPHYNHLFNNFLLACLQCFVPLHCLYITQCHTAAPPYTTHHQSRF